MLTMLPLSASPIFASLGTVMGAPVLAYEFGWPRVDFDLDPIAIVFGVFCIVLFALLLGSLITLSLFHEEKKRRTMYHSEWKRDDGSTGEGASNTRVPSRDAASKPFVSESALPKMDPTVAPVSDKRKG